MSVNKYLEKLEDLTGKKILVTGGTSGIGLSIVKQLLSKNAQVVVLARNLNKANKLKEQLDLQFPNNPIGIIKYDQGDSQSIKSASKEIIANHRDFYALVLNAGVFQTKKNMDYVNEVPQTINTNFIGLDILLNELLPHLNEPHRFIIQGSVVAGLKHKKLNSLKTNKLGSFDQYIISKCGVEAVYYHYSHFNEKFSFYLVEPGITSTDIIRDFPVVIRKAGKVFLKVFSHSPDKAALTTLAALQTNTKKDSFIVPRGIFTFMGYPKIKKFPAKRERAYLYDMLNNL